PFPLADAPRGAEEGGGTQHPQGWRAGGNNVQRSSSYRVRDRRRVSLGDEGCLRGNARTRTGG
ncbi:unnamed protein product, partial [Ectocarpus sp. 12 AP-2014]